MLSLLVWPKVRYRNDNPLLQPHLLIPYTFNKDTDQLEYNRVTISPNHFNDQTSKKLDHFLTENMT